MALLNNVVTRGLSRGVFYACTRVDVLGVERVPTSHRGLLLACSHLSHYDPFVISVVLQRRVDWMARAEFYQGAVSTWFLDHTGSFRIDRFGPALPGIREGLRRLDAGRLVGVFPEGGVVAGAASVLNGGAAKQGVALLSRRTGVPIVPCVALNSRQFSQVLPWLPLRQGRLWLGFGEPIHPDPSMPPGRRSRHELTARMEQGLRRLYGEMLARFEIPEEMRP